MRDNPLVEPIICILDAQSRSLSEYQLIQQLQQHGWLEPIDSTDNLSLYGTHFLVYNALYQLRDYYHRLKKYLRISALDISLVDCSMPSESSQSNAMSSNALDQGYHESSNELEAYYLNWDNLDSATQETVDALLDGFWSRYVETDTLSAAFETLGVDISASYEQCKRAYRRLAMTCHPDKGGTEARFQEVQQAFSVLQRHFKNIGR